ncbi:oligosaccharide flippase family protein [uncultured Desulfovibrio sp.]|uniref:lipopolysaccharide biosynthesis protein n=1 Tax=uncultured Desulfovibrio sp. TaxID=167968 RepID=UPI0026309E29|nr:oligosaccharide flippase family protein [uncultured Desulfovibrio sp.]
MKLKSIPRRLGFILGAQWTRDLAWTVFTILLARRSPDILGQIVLALTFGYLVKTVADVGLNDFLLSTFARREGHPRALLGEVTWLKLAVLLPALGVTWLVTGWQGYAPELRLVVMCIAAGLGLDGVSDSFFALCQARGRQDVEMRIRVPSALLGLGFGIVCVLLGAPPLVIALYKVAESLLCIGFALAALGRNPLAGVGMDGMKDLARQMKNGLIFTCMAACAMFYNKINVIFLKQYGGNADVGGYGVAWETVEGLSVLVSGALLGKVIFPLLARYWQQDRDAFRRLAGQTARSLWAAALPIIFLICVESDRFLPLVYGDNYQDAVTAQRLLTPCLATAFLHNLAAYAMIGMRRHRLLLGFYCSGLVCNLVCCMTLIPRMPLEGAALSLTLTKVWVAILTVGFFQWAARPMTLRQWVVMLFAALCSVGLWWGLGRVAPRELAELAGLAPLLALFWRWRPPPPFEKASKTSDAASPAA